MLKSIIKLNDGTTIDPIIYYHRVAPDADPDTGVTPETFDRQMGFLKRIGFHGVALRTVLEDAPDSRRRIAITFDDGYRDNLEWAAPILEKYGFRATIFCISGKIGGVSNWDNDPRWVGHPLLTLSQMRELDQRGFEIGSHTRSHPDLSTLSDDAVEEELFRSREELENLLGRSVETLCYPYGRYSRHTPEIARKAGYRAARTTQRMVPGQVEDRFLLPARTISGEMSYARFCLTNSLFRIL
ncbi:MAG: polysaccharide deacetylase family protein [Leptospirales bacterium]